MNEGFKEHIEGERELGFNIAMHRTLHDSYEHWRDALSEYERTNIEGELARLDTDTSQSFGIYCYLRGLAKPQDRHTEHPVTEAYRAYINEVTDTISETVSEKELGMRTRLLQKV